MNPNDPLYLYLHIPRCGGMSFRSHLEQNLKKEQLINATLELIEYSKKSNPSSTNLNEPSQETNNIYYRDEIKLSTGQISHKVNVAGYFENLSEKRKNAVKVLYGHFLACGADKYFDRPSQYITFFRHPGERIISCYNVHVNLFQVEQNQTNTFMDYERYLLINGKVPSFVEWLEAKFGDASDYPLNMSMTKMFTTNQYAIKNGDGASIKSVLDQFYFIGLMKSYMQDSLFVYHLLGIKNFNFAINKTKSFADTNDKNLHRIIREKVGEDFELYERAMEHNAAFKRAHKSFKQIQVSMFIKKSINHFHQTVIQNILKLLYRCSAKLKKSSRILKGLFD